MNGQKLVFAVVAIVSGLTIATAAGGFMTGTDYSPSVDQGTNNVTQDVKNIQIDASSPFSALSSALSLAGSLLTLPYDLTTILASFGVPDYVVKPLGVLVTVAVGFTLMNVFIRGKIFR